MEEVGCVGLESPLGLIKGAWQRKGKRCHSVMTARRRLETYKNKKPQITQITQIFFLRVPLCNFVANFLVIFMPGENLPPTPTPRLRVSA